MGQILVTGGAGFIGSHTSLCLLEKGYEILIVDSLVNSSYEAFLRIKKIINLKFPKLENNVKFVKTTTTKDFEDKNLLYDVFSSLREKINAPVRKKTK